MLKGHLDAIVLAALEAGPAHGYAIIETIKRASTGTFDLPEGTVYPALHRLVTGGRRDRVGICGIAAEADPACHHRGRCWLQPARSP